MWYLTLHRWVADREEAIKHRLDDHLRWTQENQLAGRILIAGPTTDGEVGVIVFAHMPRASLDELCAHDPFVAAGYREYEVYPWDVHQLFGIGGFDRTTIGAMTRQHMPPTSALPAS